ncbi:LAFE_0F10704g1_1 [Lachancea fermentati]|uniref:Histidinol-phosphatase n=1 Tax=Lachancea fermentati TaxID=4955 RepID=A0A1G4MFC2_LACFM|nr:LAFE_0F10704g1_1 [Lachancea fermentati]
MYSHHSHSGEYVAHGVDKLDDMVARANEMGFELYCLTEHMPRLDSKYLYPEEKTGRTESDLETLQQKFRKFMDHALTIKRHSHGAKIIIGMEVEGCDSQHIAYAKSLMEQYPDVLQFCVGSVHHVNEIPIDFNQDMWTEAVKVAGNNFKQFMIDYLNMQYKLLTELKPLVVGHFDLFKLLCPQRLCVNTQTGDIIDEGSPGAKCIQQLSILHEWEDVESLVVRNLQYIISYGGLIEINTAGLRKKLLDPFPGREFAILAKSMGARFVLSDDAHAVSHVGVCYDKALKYMDEVLRLQELHYLSDNSGSLEIKSVTIDSLKKSPFWENY